VSAAPGTATRLEKAAVDNGFDRELPRVGEWLAFGSTHAPLETWLSAAAPSQFLVALARRDVANALLEHGTLIATPLPPGAVAARLVADIPALGRLLRRAFQLARTLPHGLLHTFEHATALMPRTTEAERLVVQRVGQDVFRDGLLEYWDGKCAITGLAVPELLRASHIKPWANCETDAERLDVFNGLLLAPHLDAAFDKGFITVGGDGRIVVSALLAAEARAVLGLDLPLRVERLTDAHRHYLEWHRRTEFQSAATIHKTVRT
jgi:putative restriction endonuclease